MFELALYFLAIPAGVYFLLRLLRVKSRKLLFGIPLFILSLPFLLGTGLYLLRAPIQQGKFFAELGPLLSLVFPAEDLYEPLAEEPLMPGKSLYVFHVAHKYVGRHAVFIEIPSKDQPGWATEKSIGLSVEISKGDDTLFRGMSGLGSPYRGRGEYGYHYVGYKVPEDVPVVKSLKIKIEIKEGMDEFFNRHQNAKLIVRKTSDE